jgi:hypothetical protein
MNVTITVDEALADGYLPSARPDDSGVGANYADQVLKGFKLTLADGRKLSARRRGLKITLTIGDAQGEALLRRIEHGPDVRRIFREALCEAARKAGATLAFAPGAVHIDL